MKTMTEIMMDRWLKATKNLPEVDRKDVHEDNPRVNQNPAKPADKVRQVEPEYTQTSYHRMLQIERETRAQNYLQIQDANIASSKSSEDQQGHSDSAARHAQIKSEKHVTLSSRNYGIQRIFYLHDQKQYKRETMFIACAIFDRYIAAVGTANFE